MKKRSMDLNEIELYQQIMADLENMERGSRSIYLKQKAEQLGCSDKTIYRKLKKVGYTSGRKQRSDANQSLAASMDYLEMVGAFLSQAVRKNGKTIGSVPLARQVLAMNGHRSDLSDSQIRSLLRRAHFDMASLKEVRPCTNVRSLHPNHVHQVDPSVCLIYYLPNGGQQVIHDDEAYKNKPFLKGKEHLKVMRYVLTDHYSGTFIVRYYQVPGEDQITLYNFLLYCWAKLDGRPFHGVPKILAWDKGSANSSQGIQNALKSLGVSNYQHKPGNPRAKGSVENANNLVETQFETRLRFEPVDTVEELNAAAEAFYNAYNANAIEGLDTRLKRAYMEQGVSRYGSWQRIRENQLRLLPDIDLCRLLLINEPKIRKVKTNLFVDFKHPKSKATRPYYLGLLPGIYINQEVKITPLIYSGLDVLVTLTDRLGKTLSFEVSPDDVDEMGFRLDSPVFGEEFKKPADTIADKARKQLERKAYPGLTDEEIEKAKRKNATPFEGKIDAHSHLKNIYVPDYIDRPGTDINLPGEMPKVEALPLSVTDACKILMRQMNDAWRPEHYAQVKSWYPDGVPESELDNLEDRLQRRAATALHAVK